MRRIGWWGGGGRGRMALYFRIEKTKIVIISTSQGYKRKNLKVIKLVKKMSLKNLNYLVGSF
jgi:hypothetical protein